MIITPQQLWDMPLHQEDGVDSSTSVMRVPGGWIYTKRLFCYIGGAESYNYTSTFVPLDNEFVRGIV